jgi:hypothetical protein
MCPLKRCYSSNANLQMLNIQCLRDKCTVAQVTGWAMEQPLQTRHAPHGDKQDQPPTRQNYNDDHGHDYGGGGGGDENWESSNPHQVSDWETSSGHGSTSSSAGQGLQLGIGDMFDVALTAIAFLAFGIFILNVFLGILLPVSGSNLFNY